MAESRLRFEIGSTVVPGDRLGPARSEFAPGPGTVRCVICRCRECVDKAPFLYTHLYMDVSISHVACVHLVPICRDK